MSNVLTLPTAIVSFKCVGCRKRIKAGTPIVECFDHTEVCSPDCRDRVESELSRDADYERACMLRRAA